MGTFLVTIEVGDPAGRHYETVEALVDTGATYTTVPAPLLERLGVAPHVRDTFILADGRRVDRDIGRAWVRVDGRAELTLVVFGDPETPSLLGAYTLKGLRLAADPVGRRLIPVPAYLLESSANGECGIRGMRSGELPARAYEGTRIRIQCGTPRGYPSAECGREPRAAGREVELKHVRLRA